jgi:hypothetical protein
MPISLKQMTTLLAPISPEAPATLNRQLRAWTDAGVLPLAGGLRTGTGRGRLYEDDAPLFAALAIELTRFGADIGFIQEALAFLRSSFRAKDNIWQMQFRSGPKVNMLIMPKQQSKELSFAFMPPDQLGDYVGGPDFDAAGSSILIINLCALWAKIK